MVSTVSHTSIDCADVYALSEWWKQVLGYVDLEGDPNEPGHEECMILSTDGAHRLLFIEVPEGTSAKSRLHLDLRPTDRPRDEEVGRLLAIGAPQLADHRTATGGWVTLADPEGNELCVLRSQAEVDERADAH